MKRETKLALFASITHWKKYAADPANICIGIQDCALCQLYHPMGEYFDMNKSACEGCPIFERTGKESCRDTPYVKVKYCADLREWDYAKECAEKEVKFLQSLLPAGVESEQFAMFRFHACARDFVALRQTVEIFKERAESDIPARAIMPPLCRFYHANGYYFNKSNECCDNCPIGNRCYSTPIEDYDCLVEAFYAIPPAETEAMYIGKEDYLKSERKKAKLRKDIATKAKAVAAKAVNYLEQVIENYVV